MLKAEIKPNGGEKTSVKVEVSGDMRQICADISTLIGAINERMTENDPETGHMFKVLLTKGFMDGICFDDDREHMEHYLAEGDKAYEISKKKVDPFMKLLDDLLEFMKGKNATLEKVEDDDEAE